MAAATHTLAYGIVYAYRKQKQQSIAFPDNVRSLYRHQNLNKNSISIPK